MNKSEVGKRAVRDRAAERAKQRETTALAQSDRVERAGVPGRAGWPPNTPRYPLDDVEEEVTADTEVTE